MAEAEEWVDWIEEDGGLIESLPRAEIRRRNLLHRVTGTFVFHPDGRVFVHQRTAGKDVYPGMFDVMVGGTVVSGEGFTANACRELAEELGVRGVPIYELFGHRYRDGSTNSLIRVFACLYEGPMTFQPEEVATGFWATFAQAEELVRAGNVCPDSSQGWRRYLEQFGAEEPFARQVAGGLAPIDCAPWTDSP